MSFLPREKIIVYALTCKNNYNLHYRKKFMVNVFPFYWEVRRDLARKNMKLYKHEKMREETFVEIHGNDWIKKGAMRWVRNPRKFTAEKRNENFKKLIYHLRWCIPESFRPKKKRKKIISIK